MSCSRMVVSGGVLLGMVAAAIVAAADAKRDSKADSPVGIVSGRVTFAGRVPKASVPDNLGGYRDLLSVNQKNRGWRYVAVYLTAQQGTPAGTKDGKEKLETVVIDQEDETFLPHVVAVRDGQPVKFTNSDQANHNVRTAALDERNQFNVFTPAGGASYTHRFRADPKGRPIRIGCDIHGWMCAWIYVFDHPYFAVTDANGEFRITGVPPGKYRVFFRQPDVGFLEDQMISVTAGKTAEVSIRFQRTNVSD